jgi:hypothetical protein
VVYLCLYTYLCVCVRVFPQIRRRLWLHNFPSFDVCVLECIGRAQAAAALAEDQLCSFRMAYATDPGMYECTYTLTHIYIHTYIYVYARLHNSCTHSHTHSLSHIRQHSLTHSLTQHWPISTPHGASAWTLCASWWESTPHSTTEQSRCFATPPPPPHLLFLLLLLLLVA